MRIIRSVSEMAETARADRSAGVRIGLVPTMGYLHDGHLALVAALRPRVDRLVVSIFVNPTQFGPSEDFSRYPRDLERDEELCRTAGVDAIFHPSAADMYAPDASIRIEESALSTRLCGASRPGHFSGVCTVVAKLFHIVQPQIAAFGEKDAQQLRVIRRMTRDLNMPVEILPVPTVREPDGLAMSSRNILLTAEARAQAVCLKRALDAAARRCAEGERGVAELRKAMAEEVARSPLARIDYIEILDDETLTGIELLERPALAALAVRFGTTRLIDNIILTP
ncbi:MAG: pantoate--beta-alanine ligase [Kiritimatiellae bacterium]|nr:pantoate--beta-alanine ligase [Kiritimatiellia bacterium]